MLRLIKAARRCLSPAEVKPHQELEDSLALLCYNDRLEDMFEGCVRQTVGAQERKSMEGL